MLVRFDAPTRHLGNLLQRTVGPILRHLGKGEGPTAQSLVANRDVLR